MSQQRLLPEDYDHAAPPLQVYDARTQHYLPGHEKRLRDLRDEFRLTFHSLAFKHAPTTTPLEVEIRNGLHVNVHLADDAYRSLHAQGAVLKHAFIKVLNTKRDRYQLHGTTDTGYEQLDGIIESYRSYRDSLMHCAAFGWQSHEAYAAAITKHHVHALEHALAHQPDERHLRALRAAYITTHFSRDQAHLRRHHGIAQSARLLFDAFKQVTKTPDLDATTKLKFFEYLADLETNAIHLRRTYDQNTLRPPRDSRLADPAKVPAALRPASERFETQLLEALSEYHAD